MSALETGPGWSAIIADDDADIRALLAISVHRAGLQLIGEHDDGTSAWEAIQELTPQIVMLDVSMPGFTGLEITRMIRADERLAGTRVLLISAGVAEVSRQAGLEAGADDYISKPFSPRELAARLVTLVEQAGLA
jgi:DNA-binding response OmpR family regulator